MKKAIRIRSNPAGRVSDSLAKARSGIGLGEFCELISIHVRVCAGIDLHNPRFYLDGSGGSRKGERRLDLDGHGTPDSNVLRKIAEAGNFHFQTVWVWWDIGQPERSVRRRFCRLG